MQFGLQKNTSINLHLKMLCVAQFPVDTPYMYIFEPAYIFNIYTHVSFKTSVIYDYKQTNATTIVALVI